MKENTPYFPHDFNARNDPKLIKLAVHGLDLKSIYWDIIEMLHEQGGYMDIDPDPIAYALRADKKRVEFVLHFKGLFEVCGGKFTSQRVLDNLIFIREKSEKARKAALKRWGVHANAIQTQSEGNAIKDNIRKDKIRKDNNTAFDFSSLWTKYPNKDGRLAAERHFLATVKTEQDFKDIGLALENYLKSDVVAKGFIKNGSTWFHNWRDWVVPPKGTDDRPEYLKPKLP